MKGIFFYLVSLKQYQYPVIFVFDVGQHNLYPCVQRMGIILWLEVEGPTSAEEHTNPMPILLLDRVCACGRRKYSLY